MLEGARARFKMGMALILTSVGNRRSRGAKPLMYIGKGSQFRELKDAIVRGLLLQYGTGGLTSATMRRLIP